MQNFEEILSRLSKILEKDDVLLIQGAGNIGNFPNFLIKNWLQGL